MASVQDTVQEIPPPDVLPQEPRRGAFSVALLSLVVATAAIVSITAPEVPNIEWDRMATPGSVNLDSLVATDDGFAFLSGMTSEGILIWSLDIERGWRSQTLVGAPSQLASTGAGLIAYGEREGKLLASKGGMWESVRDLRFPADVRSRQASGRPSIIGDSYELLVVSLLGDVYWTGDGTEFVKVVADAQWGSGTEKPLMEEPLISVCQPPFRSSPDIPPLVQTDDGFLALVSTNPAEPFGISPACEPRVWVSADGRTWTATESVIDGGAYVYDLAWEDGRFTAVGGFGIGEPAAWASEDGMQWELIPQLSANLEADLFTVEAGPAGWVVLGQDAASPRNVGWTSSDGRCWDDLPPQVKGGDAAVSESHILIMERSAFPELWLGTVAANPGACR